MTTAERLAIILGWLMLSITALTQTTNNGNVVSVGQVSHGGGGGAPLTYSARTDLCVTGSETGCTGLGLSFQMRTTDMVPFADYPNAPVNAAATDPDFHSYLVMATDWTTKLQTSEWDVNNGDQAAFNINSTLLHLTQKGGNRIILLVNPTAIHVHQPGTCSGCAAATSIIAGTVEPACGTSCTKLDLSGVEVWSLVPGETNVLYELAGDNVTINKLTLQANCTMATPSACTFSRMPYVQFTSDIPVPCSLWGAKGSVYQTGNWNGITNIAYDGSITITTGGAPDWQPNTSYTAIDDFIFPQINNGSKVNAFQATTSGTSGGSGSEPNWATTCGTAGQTCTDNGATWLNIGKVTGQDNGFDVLNFDVHRGCSRLNTVNAKVYRGTNQGSAWPNPGTPDPSGPWTTDDNYICERYGVSYPGTCPLTDKFKLHEGGSKPDSRYANIAPSSGADCFTSGQCACTHATNANYRHMWSASTDYIAGNHDVVFDPSGPPYSIYIASANSGPSYGGPQPPDSNPTYWTPGDDSCGNYVWQTQSTIIRPCLSMGSSLLPECDGHGLTGYTYAYWGTQAGGLRPHFWSRPSINASANPGVPSTVPSQGLTGGHHGSYLNSGTTELTPLGIIQTDVPTATYAIGASNLPWYAELLGVAVDGSNTVYRFAHAFNTGSEPVFNGQNNVGAISEDGQFMAVTTDMMGTRGSVAADWQAANPYALGGTMFPTSGNPGNYDFQATVAGTSAGTEPSWCQISGCTTTDGGVTWTNLGGTCNRLRGFYHPSASTAFALNDTVFPVSNNANGNIFKATQAGTTYSSLPAWNTLAPNWGNTFCDDAAYAQNAACSAGVVQWTNIGPNDCRYDVMIVDLLSAH